MNKLYIFSGTATYVDSVQVVDGPFLVWGFDEWDAESRLRDYLTAIGPGNEYPAATNELTRSEAIGDPVIRELPVVRS